MYNYSIDVNYNHVPENKQDTLYRKLLLDVFNTGEYDDKILTINKIQCELYKQLKDNKSLIEVLNFFQNNQQLIPLTLHLETCFVFLFSFDFFFIFHKCLQDLDRENIISNVNKENLYFLIKKK